MPNVDDQLAEHYDAYYDGVSGWREVSAVDKAAHIRVLWRRVGLPLSGRVADIGCGEGAVAEVLARAGFAVDGFDISASGVSAARGRSGAATYATYDGVRLPVEDQSYDLAVLSHVVEHVEHPRVLLSEARRVARWVYVEVPLELTLRTPEHFTWTDLGHINLYSALTVRHLVESMGFRVVAEESFDHSLAVSMFHGRTAKALAKWTIRRIAHTASPRLAHRLFVYHYGILASSE
jgi:ubiquinone/menaquinone biosynthesis C-methylase UbiE